MSGVVEIRPGAGGAPVVAHPVHAWEARARELDGLPLDEAMFLRGMIASQFGSLQIRLGAGGMLVMAHADNACAARARQLSGPPLDEAVFLREMIASQFESWSE